MRPQIRDRAVSSGSGPSSVPNRSPPVTQSTALAGESCVTPGERAVTTLRLDGSYRSQGNVCLDGRERWNHMDDDSVQTRGKRALRRHVSLVTRAGSAATEASGRPDAAPARSEYVPIALFGLAALGTLWATIAAPHG